jgi:rhodanese-related sulfurtransferase
LQALELAYAPPFSSAKDPVNMAGYTAANILDGMAKPFYLEDIANISKDDLLLDVRTPEEFHASHLPHAVNIPVDELRLRLGELDPEKKIYVYCAVGLRGYVAQRILMQKGYESLNLSGGYTLWQALDKDRRAQDRQAKTLLDN